MTKQEEIRERIRELIEPIQYDGASVQETTDAIERIFAYLHSQGVAIKVEGELPKPISRWDKELTMEEISTLTQLDMEVAGYTAVEPLIEQEVKVG